MKIKITGKNKELFDHYLKSVLNIACIAAMGGNLPTNLEIESPMGRGRYWFREENRFHLYPMSNDYWANIRQEGENFIVLEFSYRYDKDNAFSDALCNLLAARFRGEVTFSE
jgi:hypothetical protein